MRRRIALSRVEMVVALVTATPVLAAKPTKEVIDIGSPAFEAMVEADLLALCGFAIELDGAGHIVVHEFQGHRRLVEIDNYRMFETFSANGKSVVVHPDAGPDILWIGEDGHLYIALVGRYVTGSGVIGRTVFDLDTGELVSSHGRDVGDFIDRLCTELAPPP
jgi:hypothetical protein